MLDPETAAPPLRKHRLRRAAVAALVVSPILCTFVLAQSGVDVGAVAKAIATGSEKTTKEKTKAAEDLLAAAVARGGGYTFDAQAIAQGNAAAIRRGLGLTAQGEGAFADGARDMLQAGEGDEPAIYIAVSLTMPPEALRRLVKDADKAGAQVVIRGFVNNSMEQTAAAARRAMDQDLAGGVAIDPQVFRAYGIQRVPAFIVARSPVTPCDGVDCVSAAAPHDRVSGNISLGAALKVLADEGDAAPDVAAAALARLEG